MGISIFARPSQAQNSVETQQMWRLGFGVEYNARCLAATRPAPPAWSEQLREISDLLLQYAHYGQHGL